MSTINVYLSFNGNCVEAFNFYRSVFGGEFQHSTTYREMPNQEGMPEVREEDRDKIMHISLPIGKESVLMGCDLIAPWAAEHNPGNNFSLSVNTSSKEETEEVFNNLAVLGKVTMPLGETFWGSYFGMLKDRFGISWMVSCEL